LMFKGLHTIHNIKVNGLGLDHCLGLSILGIRTID